MKALSQKEKEKILSKIFWDLHIAPNEIDIAFNASPQKVTSIRQINLLRRLLNSCDWYTMLKLFPLEKMNVILSDAIIKGLYPKDIQRKYIYARKYLSR